MYKVIYSEESIKDLHKLDKAVGRRIVEKIAFFSKQNDLSKFSKALKGFDGKYRFRVGDYRVIYKIGSSGEIQILMVLNVKHRKDVYKL